MAQSKILAQIGLSNWGYPQEGHCPTVPLEVRTWGVSLQSGDVLVVDETCYGCHGMTPIGERCYTAHWRVERAGHVVGNGVAYMKPFSPSSPLYRGEDGRWYTRPPALQGWGCYGFVESPWWDQWLYRGRYTFTGPGMTTTS